MSHNFNLTPNSDNIELQFSYSCLRRSIIPGFSAQNLRVHILLKNYIIFFFPGSIPHHIRDEMTESKLRGAYDKFPDFFRMGI